MSDLRRRVFGVGASPDSTPSASPREQSPAPGHQVQDGRGEIYHIVPDHKIDKLKKEMKAVRRKGSKRRNVWMFILGGAFGLLLAGFFASRNGNFDTWIEMAGMKDMNLESFLDVLPAGIIRDVQDLQVRRTMEGLLLFDDRVLSPPRG